MLCGAKSPARMTGLLVRGVHRMTDDIEGARRAPPDTRCVAPTRFFPPHTTFRCSWYATMTVEEARAWREALAAGVDERLLEFG